MEIKRGNPDNSSLALLILNAVVLPFLTIGALIGFGMANASGKMSETGILFQSLGGYGAPLVAIFCIVAGFICWKKQKYTATTILQLIPLPYAIICFALMTHFF